MESNKIKQIETYFCDFFEICPDKIRVLQLPLFNYILLEKYEKQWVSNYRCKR